MSPGSLVQHPERSQQSGRLITKVTRIAALLTAWSGGQILGQSANTSDLLGESCVERIRTAMTQTANGRLKEAEDALAPLLSAGADPGQTACAGVVLNNMAALLSISGRPADGAILAEQSVRTLEKV